MRGSSRVPSAGAVSRFGPTVRPGRRMPMRGNNTGSVMMLMPARWINTVEWPSHAAVTVESSHALGAGFATAGNTGRQLSIVHSRQRCPNQLRIGERRRFAAAGEVLITDSTHATLRASGFHGIAAAFCYRETR